MCEYFKLYYREFGSLKEFMTLKITQLKINVWLFKIILILLYVSYI